MAKITRRNRIWTASNDVHYMIERDRLSEHTVQAYRRRFFVRRSVVCKCPRLRHVYYPVVVDRICVCQRDEVTYRPSMRGTEFKYVTVLPKHMLILKHMLIF